MNNVVIDTLYKTPNIIILKEAATHSQDYSFIVPLLAALAGGVIVLIGQSIDRNYKRENEKKDILRDIYANCRKLEALMKNHYRELALFNTRSEYRWYCTIVTTEQTKKEGYNAEHIKYNNIARDIERKIGETKAEFIGQARKFQSILPLKADFESDLLTISDLQNISPNEYEKSILKTEILELIKKDEKELRAKYYENLKSFKSINEYLQTLI